MNAKPMSEDQIAAQLAQLVTADLAATMAVLAGMLQSVRESAEPGTIADARWAADALRNELNRWRNPPSKNDRLKTLREAGQAAAKH